MMAAVLPARDTDYGSRARRCGIDAEFPGFLDRKRYMALA